MYTNSAFFNANGLPCESSSTDCTIDSFDKAIDAILHAPDDPTGSGGAPDDPACYTQPRCLQGVVELFLFADFHENDTMIGWDLSTTPPTFNYPSSWHLPSGLGSAWSRERVQTMVQLFASKNVPLDTEALRGLLKTLHDNGGSPDTVSAFIQGLSATNVTVQQLRDAGVTEQQLGAAGVAHQRPSNAETVLREQLAAGVTPQQLLAAGATPQQLLAAGATPQQLIDAGVPQQALVDAGVPPSSGSSGSGTASAEGSTGSDSSGSIDPGGTTSSSGTDGSSSGSNGSSGSSGSDDVSSNGSSGDAGGRSDPTGSSDSSSGDASG
ncbi:hypothetical protein ACFPK1_12510 [Actinomycetospora rhizophila]|uniref:Uncharacterized protein n=1 Tax=Actinomycetospora rhizophila TaxID=1416876 RepID=A0ABV9ZEV8_9PSEU